MAHTRHHLSSYSRLDVAWIKQGKKHCYRKQRISKDIIYNCWVPRYLGGSIGAVQWVGVGKSTSSARNTLAVCCCRVVGECFARVTVCTDPVCTSSVCTMKGSKWRWSECSWTSMTSRHVTILVYEDDIDVTVSCSHLYHGWDNLMFFSMHRYPLIFTISVH